ncbi:11864_t:CDS:2 [Acaulospora morrowiae]|uniref:11864_t:CDS:1 n=1 Tax=Acaulospora morrowiae TaxID=94023 RepID=A0A9N8Z125_9GLOM|nr:11864_t:CDS:2 [Acaulospora morrowiae]
MVLWGMQVNVREHRMQSNMGDLEFPGNECHGGNKTIIVRAEMGKSSIWRGNEICLIAIYDQ